MRSVLKAIGAPGSLGFFAVGAAAGLFLVVVSKRTRRSGRLVLMTLVIVYLALSLPWVSDLVSTVLPRPSIQRPTPSDKIDQLFVLDGDNYRARAKTACEVFAQHRPRIVWIQGSMDLRDELVACGVPADLWAWGSGGNRTTQQVRNVQQHAVRPDAGRLALVVSRVQLPRVAALVRAAGLDVAIIASPVDREPASSGFGRLLPSFSALAVSRDAIYEIAAYAYYRLNGWL